MTDVNLTYSVGTCSVGVGGTTVTGVGTLWAQSVNVRQWDMISINNGPLLPVNATPADNTHLTIPAWAGTAQVAVPYVIYQISPLRFVGGQAMAAVDDMLAKLNTDGWYRYVNPAFTDPTAQGLTANEGQFALKYTTGQLWIMTGGVWVLEGIYKGFNPKGAWNSATAYITNDIVNIGAASYFCILANTNQTPPNATYWQPLAPAPFAPIAPWATATNYVASAPASFVSQAGSSYVCLIAHTSGTFATDLAAGKWGLIASIGATGAVAAAGDGSQAAPGIAFASETSSGIWRIGAGHLGVSITNTKILDLTATAIAAVVAFNVISAPLTLNGNITSAGWTTNGVQFIGTPATFTDNSTAAGTVASAYSSVSGGNTIATAVNAVTFTNYFEDYFKAPFAGAHVTLTNGWALGADNIKVGTSNPFSISTVGAISAGNTLTIAPPANSTNAGINITQTSPTSGTAAGPLSFNLINVNNQVSVTTAGVDSGGLANSNVAGFRVNVITGGSNVQAQTNSAAIFTIQNTIGASSSGDVVGVLGYAYTNIAHTGHGTFGMNAACVIGPSGSDALLIGIEADVLINTGGTSNYRVGFNAMSGGNVNASTMDAAFMASSNSSTTKWKHLIALSNVYANNPLATTADLLFSDTAFTIANGINLPNATITGNIFDFGTPFKITGAGHAGFAGAPGNAILNVISPTSNAGTANTIRFFDDGAASTSTTSNSYGIGLNLLIGQMTFTAGTGGTFQMFTSNTARFAITPTGACLFATNIAAVSTITGTIVNSGGLGNAGDAWIGGIINVAGVATIANSSASTTPANGALIVSGGVGIGGQITGGGAIVSISPSAGIGYAVGAGAVAATQTGTRNTGVTSNTISGDITLLLAVNAATTPTLAISFVVTCSACAVNDTPIVTQKSGTDKWFITVSHVAAGSFTITAYSVGTTNESPVFHYNIIKGANS